MWRRSTIKSCQFSLGNSFWIHPLVQLSVYIFGAWYPVSFFVARPVREAYLNMAADIAGIMISWYRMWCHAMISGMWCHVMISGMWCHAMISGMWCHAMISGMWWCHVHHDIGYVMMSCPCYWHYGMLCRHITSSCNDSLPLRLTSAILKEHRCHFIPKRCDDIGIYMMSCHDIDGNMMSCHDNICDFMPW